MLRYDPIVLRYEINTEYVKLAKRRIGEFSMLFNAPKLFNFKESIG